MDNSLPRLALRMSTPLHMLVLLCLRLLASRGHHSCYNLLALAQSSVQTLEDLRLTETSRYRLRLRSAWVVPRPHSEEGLHRLSSSTKVVTTHPTHRWRPWTWTAHSFILVITLLAKGRPVGLLVIRTFFTTLFRNSSLLQRKFEMEHTGRYIIRNRILLGHPLAHHQGPLLHHHNRVVPARLHLRSPGILRQVDRDLVSRTLCRHKDPLARTCLN